MATIMHLSEDIISIVLSITDISVKDVVSFSSTCKYFHNMIQDNTLIWQRKAYQRWPHLRNSFEKYMCTEHVTFKDIIKIGTKCKTELWQVLAQMSRKYYIPTVFSNYHCAPHAFTKPAIQVDEKDLHLLIHSTETIYSLNYYFLIDELTRLLEHSQSGHRDELTNIYYGKKLIPFLKHYHLRSAWQQFINRPPEQQLLEEAATFVSQWCQPEENVSYTRVETELDNIARQVLKHLAIVNSTHPIFSTSEEQFSLWKYNNIDESQWNNGHANQILDILLKVLSKLNFYGIPCPQGYNSYFSREYIYIDCVLRKKSGYIISLAIIFQSVARRLGVRCDLISFPAHCFLTWKPKYNERNCNDEQYFYIDILRRTFVNKNDCPRIHGIAKCPLENVNKPGRIYPVELIVKLVKHIQLSVYQYDDMKWDILHWSLELQCLINPDDKDAMIQLKNRYQNQKRSLTSLLSILRQMYHKGSSVGKMFAKERLLELRTLPSSERPLFIDKVFEQAENIEYRVFELKQRTREMKFAVGMIVKKKNATDIGVIIGRVTPIKCKDCIKKITEDDPHWFYVIIYEKTEQRSFVNKDTIIKLDKPRPVNHSEIGKYFSEFKGTFYMPNEILKEEYPDDVLYLMSHNQQ